MKIIDSTPVIADDWKPVVDAQTAALEAVDSLYRDRFEAIASKAKTASAQGDAERTLRDLCAEHFAAREPLSKALAETRMRAERPRLVVQLEPGEAESKILGGLRAAIDIKNGDDQPSRAHVRRSHGLPPAKG